MDRERKIGVLAFFCTAAVISIMCMVGRQVSAADIPKIALVDLMVAFNESEVGKKAMAELDSFIKSKKSTIEEKGKVIERLKGELEKQGSVLSPDAKKAKEEEIERLMRDAQRHIQDAENEVNKKKDKIRETIIKDLQAIISKIGQEEGYTLILEKGISLFASKEIDITEKVVKRYNEMQPKGKQKN